MTEPAASFYVTGGTLKPGEPSYVERRADTELFESLLAGEVCYVLTARQMGKSSLMARTAKRLEQAGVASAIVDLTQIGSERGSQAEAQWYFGVANKIHQQLKIAEPLRPWWQERSDLSSVQRLTDFFREIVLAHHLGKVVIFVDEIDSTIGLPFADDFFAALRACFNARATESEFERLTFVLLGVATPDQLIRDQTRTPFNIGKRIDLTDFRPDEAEALAPGLHADSTEAGRRLERVLHWTGGHPYLTQALCRAVRETGEAGTAEQVVDPQVQELFLASQAQREETNLKHARARLEKPGSEGRRLLQLYRRVCLGKPVLDQPTSPLFAQIKLAGVVKATDEGRLEVRNRIYETVFTPEWAKFAMPADRGRRVAAVMLAATLTVFVFWYAAFQPRPYEEALRAAIKDDGYNGAMEAYAALRSNPFSRSRATDLMQEFWEQRALRYALDSKRDESLLSYLQGLDLKDNERLRRQAQNLVGSDYERLLSTFRYGGIAADMVTAMAFSPDGRTLAGATEDSLTLWDTRSEKAFSTLSKSGDSVEALAFSPDGRTIAIGGRSLRLWNARSGKPLATSFKQTAGVYAIAFSPDGRTLATGGWDGTAQLWDARSGKPLATSFEHGGYVKAMVFNSDGTPAAPPKDTSFVTAIAFSLDGRTLATGGWDGTVRLWDTRSGKPLATTFEHGNPVAAVAFSPDGRTLATGSTNQTAQLWDARSGNPLAPPFQHQGDIYAVSFSPNGRTLASAARDGTVRLWDVRSEKLPALRPSSTRILS